MEKPAPNASAWLADYGGRVFLTLLAVLFFTSVWIFWARVHATFLATRNLMANSPLIIGNKVRPGPSDPIPHPFWPEYPRNNPGVTQSAVINGVPVVTENWDTTASAGEVFSYYREQMIPRGWRDTTEQTFNLQPDAHKNNPQDANFIAHYNQIMSGNLVLNRDGWTINITVGPSQSAFEQNEVKFYAAQSTSIKNLFDSMEGSMTGNGQPFDAVQTSGGDLYHTTIVNLYEPPSTAFQETLAKCASQGWHKTLTFPGQQAQSGYFVWLVRGKQYAALSVQSLSKGGSSSVTFMEVTPKLDKR